MLLVVILFNIKILLFSFIDASLIIFVKVTYLKEVKNIKISRIVEQYTCIYNFSEDILVNLDNYFKKNLSHFFFILSPTKLTSNDN